MEKEFEYKEEYGWLTNICLNVTDACNLACRYCFVEQHPHYMTLDIAKQAVTFIMNNYEKKINKFQDEKINEPHITFFGGEPTIMWDEIIEPLTKYIRENKLPISLSMTTNGTLLNPTRIAFLKENSVNLLLSIDGDKKTQDFNRPCHGSEQSSFDLVNNNLELLLKEFPNLTFRGTIYAPTVENTFENYLFALKKGFKNIFLMPDARHAWTEEQKKSLYKEVCKIFSFMDFCFSNGLEPLSFSSIEESFKLMLKHDVLALNNFQSVLNINRSEMRCGLGTVSGSIGYDGSIFGCQEQPSKNKDNIFYLGNIYESGIEPERHISLLTEYSKKYISTCDNQSLCEQCKLRNICLGFNCPSSSYDLFQNFSTNTEIACLWKQWLFENSIILNNKLVAENNLLFKNYLTNKCDFKKLHEQEAE